MNKIKKNYRLFIIVCLSIFIIAAGVMALTNPEIPRYHLGAAGESSGGGYTLNGSIGQPDAGQMLSGGDYTLSGGFWGAGGDRTYAIYIPLVLK